MNRQKGPSRRRTSKENASENKKKFLGRKERQEGKQESRKPFVKRHKEAKREEKAAFLKKEKAPTPRVLRLNQYIARSGICSRREADKLIAAGRVKVNGSVVKELGLKVKRDDLVEVDGRRILPESFVYILLNKPKNYITTTKDPRGRRTVMDLIRGACEQRVYPVGRLDRDTTGLLLLTNDGDLAEKLAHPSHRVSKVYEVTLDKPLAPEHLEAIKQGVRLEEGVAQVDDIALIKPHVVGLELHIGWNRVVRRIFEQLGYEVKHLDRTLYAGLSKKDLPRGKWRFLTKEEVIQLKYMMQE